MTGIPMRKLTGLCCLLMALAGCGGGADEGPPRIDISGDVTFDGAPIPAGEITFIPNSKKGNSGPAASVVIEDGKYTTVDRGKGIVGGPHILRITAFDGVADPANELPSGKPLFPTYEMEADLPKEVDGNGPAKHDVAVPKEAKNPPKKRRNPRDSV